MAGKVDAAQLERALEGLLDEGEKLLRMIRQRGADALLAGDYHYANWANQSSRILEEAIKKLRDVQKEADKNLHGRGPVRLDSRPEPRRRRPGLSIPQHEYMTPILVELLELGGVAATSVIRERIWNQLRDRLGPDDLAGVPSDPHCPVWWNRACWARNHLKEQGLIEKDTPRGIWELTQQGRAEAAKRRFELQRLAAEE
mgnify:CR=1 FL=1